MIYHSPYMADWWPKMAQDQRVQLRREYRLMRTSGLPRFSAKSFVGRIVAYGRNEY